MEPRNRKLRRKRKNQLPELKPITIRETRIRIPVRLPSSGINFSSLLFGRTAHTTFRLAIPSRVYVSTGGGTGLPRVIVGQAQTSEGYLVHAVKSTDSYFFEHISSPTEKRPLQACTVICKLTRVIHGQLIHNQAFNNCRFHALPGEKIRNYQ